MSWKRWTPWSLEARLLAVEHRTNRLESLMGKNSDALSRLDIEIEDLRSYVESDDETDAAEVDSRAAKIREILAAARGDENVPNDEVDSREEDLNEVVDQVAPVADAPAAPESDETA